MPTPAPECSGLLWASTSAKDPSAPDDLYVAKLAAPFTVNTVPEATLRAYYDHGSAPEVLPPDHGDAATTLAAFAAAGVDVDDLAEELQTKGADQFVAAWNDLIAHIETQAARVTRVTGASWPDLSPADHQPPDERI